MKTTKNPPSCSLSRPCSAAGLPRPSPHWTTSLRTSTLLALCIGSTFAGLSPTSAGPLIYSTAEHGTLLVTTDFRTGETMVIGPTGQIGTYGLAANGDGTLYTVTHAFDTTGESQLAKLDLSTGKATPF